MRIIRENERVDLMEKFSEQMSKLENLVHGEAMPDPKDGQKHLCANGGLVQDLHNGKLKEPFSRIDDLEIEFTIDNINTIIKKILKLQNHRHDIYTFQYTDYENNH